MALRKRIVLVAVVSVCVITIVISIVTFAATRNLAPDAVTRATTYNEKEGDLTSLIDGKYPGNNPSPTSFKWNNKGVLLFDLPKPVEVTEFRMYIGKYSGGYILKAYLGGRGNEEGMGRDPQGELKATVENAEYLANQWVTLKLPPGTIVDNLELSTFGTAEFYEIEILGPVETSVKSVSWAQIKSAHR